MQLNECLVFETNVFFSKNNKFETISKYEFEIFNVMYNPKLTQYIVML